MSGDILNTTVSSQASDLENEQDSSSGRHLTLLGVPLTNDHLPLTPTRRARVRMSVTPSSAHPPHTTQTQPYSPTTLVSTSTHPLDQSFYHITYPGVPDSSMDDADLLSYNNHHSEHASAEISVIHDHKHEPSLRIQVSPNPHRPAQSIQTTCNSSLLTPSTNTSGEHGAVSTTPSSLFPSPTPTSSSSPPSSIDLVVPLRDILLSAGLCAAPLATGSSRPRRSSTPSHSTNSTGTVDNCVIVDHNHSEESISADNISTALSFNSSLHAQTEGGAASPSPSDDIPSVRPLEPKPSRLHYKWLQNERARIKADDHNTSNNNNGCSINGINRTTSAGTNSSNLRSSHPLTATSINDSSSSLDGNFLLATPSPTMINNSNGSSSSNSPPTSPTSTSLPLTTTATTAEGTTSCTPPPPPPDLFRLNTSVFDIPPLALARLNTFRVARQGPIASFLFRFFNLHRSAKFHALVFVVSSIATLRIWVPSFTNNTSFLASWQSSSFSFPTTMTATSSLPASLVASTLARTTLPPDRVNQVVGWVSSISDFLLGPQAAIIPPTIMVFAIFALALKLIQWLKPNSQLSQAIASLPEVSPAFSPMNHPSQAELKSSSKQEQRKKKPSNVALLLVILYFFWIQTQG